MTNSIRISIRDGVVKQSLSWLLLLSVSFALTGVLSVSRKDPGPPHTERFPCEHSACGCPSAEYCWDKCCCHSDREKLQWAAKNGVTPPAFLVERVGTAGSLVDASSAAAGCCQCSAGAPTTCQPQTDCQQSKTVRTADCCGQEERHTRVLLWKAAECRGMQYLWTMLACAYVPPAGSGLEIEIPFLEWLTLSDERAMMREEWPDPPVP